MLLRVPGFLTGFKWALREGLPFLMIPVTGVAYYRFTTGDHRARRALRHKRYNAADRLAREALDGVSRFPADWNRGNVIHKANLTLGHVALARGRTDEATRHLLEAGRTPGSPQLNSFGPNMALARELLLQGQTSAVLEYFELCRAFWESPFSKLDQWTSAVKEGGIPDFGPNLIY